jgi:hypothetical protein
MFTNADKLKATSRVNGSVTCVKPFRSLVHLRGAECLIYGSERVALPTKLAAGAERTTGRLGGGLLVSAVTLAPKDKLLTFRASLSQNRTVDRTVREHLYRLGTPPAPVER